MRGVVRLRLGKIYNVPIYAHLGWFLLLALLFVGIAESLTAFYPEMWLGSIAFLSLLVVLCFSVSILLHELGHVLVARHYNLGVEQISLTMQGGIAQVAGDPAGPRVEFFVAAAGPIVSMLLVLLFVVSEGIATAVAPRTPLVAICRWAIGLNALLVAFNLLPCYPLDGGRVLLALLWRISRNLPWARQRITSIGKALALALMVFGGGVAVYRGVSLGRAEEVEQQLAGQQAAYGLLLALTGWYLWSAAQAGYKRMLWRETLRGVFVRDIMIGPSSVVPTGTSLETFARRFVTVSGQLMYPVTSADQVIGTISSGHLRRFPRSHWAVQTIDRLVVPLDPVAILQPADTIIEVFHRLTLKPLRHLLVLEQGKLVGAVTAREVRAYLP